MLRHLLRTLRNRFTPWHRTAPKRRPCRRAGRLHIEFLEDRTVPSTVTWVNPSGGDWGTAANWSDGSTNRLPGPNDDVVINQPGAVTITHSQNVADAVHSLTAADPLTLSAGSLTVSTTFTDTSAVALGGGTLSGATVQAGTVLQAAAGTTSTLQGVTLAGELDITAANASVSVAGAGLTLAGGTVNVGSGDALAFSGTQTLGAAPAGTVTLSGGSLLVPAGSALTVGAGVTVHGAGTVGSGGAVTNNGTLASDAGGLLVVQGATNYSAGTLTGGAWQAVGNSTLELPGAAVTTNAASVLLDGPNALLSGDAGATNALAGLSANAAGGTLSLRDGALLNTAANALSNAGAVSVGAGSTLAAPTYTQTAGATSLQGGTVGALLPPEHKALFFDGLQDFVQAPNTAADRGTPQMTIEAWVNPASLNNQLQGIAGTWDDLTGNNRSSFLWVQFGHLAFYVSHTGSDFPSVVSTTTLQPGRWYHVAGTFDGTSLRLYVNGVLEATTVSPGPVNTNGHAFMIGRVDGAGAGQYFDGQIADVRLWTTARSQADVQANMFRELSGSETGLTGYWPLDEGNGTTAFDRTTNHDDATLSSPAPAWGAVLVGAVNVQGGTLSGPGTVNANLSNAAEVDLGAATGTLSVRGNYTQSAAGALAIKVGGTAAGSYDQFNVGGAANLDGALNVSLTNGFIPLAGQHFHVLTFASVNNGFAAVHEPTADGVPAFTTQGTATGLDLVGATVPPTSTVSPLPAQSPPTFTVRWTGQDNAGGTGLAFFDIYVSDNGGAFAPFVLHTTQTSATFTGQLGHTYGFYSVATDNEGNREAIPTQAEATTTVPTQVGTTTALTSSAAGGSTYGQAVTFTATVSAASGVFGTPTGSVQFALDGVNLGGPVTLANGSAAVTTTALTAGNHQITATYTSDVSVFGASAGGPLAQAVAQAPLVVTATNNTKVYGDALPTLTGSVSGLVNGDVITATFTTTATAASAVGTYPITATLQDSGNRLANYAVTMNNGTLTVTPATLTVTADDQTMVAGSEVPTLTASYSGFVNGDTSAVLGGAPSLSTTATSSSPPGDYPITAAQGTLSAANYTFAFAAGTLTVTPATLIDTTTTLVSSANPSVYGQPVTFTATVSPVSGAGTPTGSVTFSDGGTVLATVELVDGQASFTTDALTLGRHHITAAYDGDGNFLASTSPVLTQKVQTACLEPDPVVPGRPALFVGGTPGDNIINITSAGHGRKVVVSVQETGPGNFSFQHFYSTAGLSRLVVFGGPGNDALVVDPGVKLPALLFAGDGNDYLQAGGGPSVLVGGGGTDVLVGGRGRDILIGGAGSDLLIAGNGGDILIGGTTDYDHNAAALSALLAEWGRTDEGYAARVSHLLGPSAGGSDGGANGAFYLNPDTVHDDGAGNVLAGGQGRDWFFASAAGQDLLLNRHRGEVVTDMS
jgi:hypothetical protein